MKKDDNFLRDAVFAPDAIGGNVPFGIAGLYGFGYPADAPLPWTM